MAGSNHLTEPAYMEVVAMWSDPEAEAFLNWPADQPLPKQGRLQQLLARTQKLLSAPLIADHISYSAAEAAVRCEAVRVLARLFHMLQQNPSQNFKAPPPNNPHESTWFCVMATLRAVTMSVNPNNVDMLTPASEHEAAGSGTLLSCSRQLEEASGNVDNVNMSRSSVYSTWHIGALSLAACLGCLTSQSQ